jgi:hypothetical protein
MSYVSKAFTALALSATASLFAGGFWLQVGSPDASPEAQSKHAALIIQSTGCADPATATVSGTVIRVIDKRQQTAPLKIERMEKPGFFAIVRQWPADAAVTLEFVGHNGTATTSLLVHASGDKVEKGSVKFYPRVPTAAEETEMASLVR